MSRDLVNEICKSLPGAEWSDPWGGGHDAWKIGGKMFASMGAVDEGVSLKTASIDTAQLLIEAGDAKRAPYFHKSWVRLPPESDPAFLKARIEISYDLIRASLTKKFQATLPPRS